MRYYLLTNEMVNNLINVEKAKLLMDRLNK